MKIKKILVSIFIIFSLNACGIVQYTEDTSQPLSDGEVEATVAAIVSSTLEAQTGGEQVVDEEPTAESTQAPTDSPAPTPTPTETPLLPQSLVFLTKEGNRTYKIARFEQDGSTLTYLTNAPEEINSFAINPFDQSIAYIAGNNIYHMESDGSDKYILIAGMSPTNTDDYFYFQSFYGLAWFPDGQTLAFGKGGLNTYNMETGHTTNLITNQVIDFGTFLNPEELFFPVAYSSDGIKLLVSVNWMEAGTIGIYDFSSSSFTQLSTSSVCCDYSWSYDSSRILVANPFLGLLESGFWAYNASSGIKQHLISNSAGVFYSPGWPIELGNGEINFFNSTSPVIPEGYFDLYMTQSIGGDVTNTIILNPNGYPISDAAWTTDGIFAAIKLSGPTPSDATPIKIISSDGTPIINVHPNALMPTWVP